MNRISSFITSLKENKLTPALAENVTRGLATQKLSTCKGSSKVPRAVLEINEKACFALYKMIREKAGL